MAARHQGETPQPRSEPFDRSPALVAPMAVNGLMRMPPAHEPATNGAIR